MLTCATSDPRLVGDPVDTLTGALFDSKLEFRLTGPLELWWWRHYDSSQIHRRFALGWGHTHDYDRGLYFDADGMRYEAPLGRVTGFAPLMTDGAEEINQGFVLRRLSLRQYQLSRHGEPSMEFEFHHPRERARLTRMFSGVHQIGFDYNDARQLTGMVDSAGRKLELVEDAEGRLLSVSLTRPPAEGPLLFVAYEYDQHGDLVRTTNASGSGYRFEYDGVHRMLRRIGRKGFNFHFAYDAQGRCVKSTGDDRLYEATLEYAIPGRMTRVTRADGGVWSYFFDEAGGLTQIHDPTGAVQQYVRDANGRVAAKVDAIGNTTRVLYDAAGAPVAEITPLGLRIPLPRDPNVVERRRRAVASKPLEYEYGRMIAADDIVLPTEAQARTLPVAEPPRRLMVVRPESLNGASDEQARVRPLGLLWWPNPERGRQFDSLGKLVGQTDHWGRQRSWRYDAAGNAAGYVDFDGGTWSYEYGSWHFLLAETNPLGHETQFSFTHDGDIASCTDPGGARSEYRHDLRDRVTEIVRHGRVRDRYVRDPAGNVVSKLAADGRELLAIEVGIGSLPAKRTLASGDEHVFQHDTSGRHLRAATLKDSLTFAYTSTGQCREEKRNGKGVEHTFGEWREPEQSVVFDRFVVRFDRRLGGRLIITDPGGHQQEINAIGLHGIIERRFSNGTEEVAQYDRFGRCLFKSARRRNGVVWNRRYHWSGEGELRRVEDNDSGDVRFEYDAAHRLNRRILPGDRVERFELDRAGNLVAKPGLSGVSLDQGNRLATVNGFAVRHNDRNHVSERESVGGPIQYVYDSCDQLVAVTSNQGTWTSDYDALGRRSRKTWAGQTTEFYWNGDQVIAEIHSTGRCRLYLYADSLALTPLMMLEYDSVDAAPESCRRYFISTDQVGTPCAIDDEKGARVWQAVIAPYGEAEITSAAIEFNLRFPGHYFDAELGVHYNRFRYYDPALGRYLQSDPWGIAGGTNLYAYPPNPLSIVDVQGLGEGNRKGDDDDPNCEGRRSQSDGEDLDGKYGEVKDPTKVKPHERDANGNVIVNPDLQEVKPGQPPNLDPSKQWLWLIDPQGRLLVGAETPMGPPDPNDGFQPKLGHPTLVGGGSEPPPARMGGELKQNPDGSWSVNNNSGRYSEHPDRGPEQLNNVNQRFQESGLDMGPPQDNPNRRKPKP